MTDNDKMTYYNLVRTTIHGLDGIRLKAAVSGLSVCTGYIAVGITLIHYVGTVEILSINVPVGHIFSTALCIISSFIAFQFVRKISMFSYFIKHAVDIALTLEEELIPEEELRLTMQFNKHKYAGKNGDRLFKIAMYFIIFLACSGAIISILACIYNKG